MRSQPPRCGLIVLVLILLSASAVSAEPPVSALARVNALWVAESDGTLKITTAEGDLLFEIQDLKDVRAVAVDQRRLTVWLYGESTLAAYDFDGERLFGVPVGPTEPSPARLALNEDDGSVWLAVEKELWSLSSSGTLLASLVLEEPVQALAVDPNASILWIGTTAAVLAYFPSNGERVQIVQISDLQDLAAEPSAGGFWAARQDSLVRYEAGGDPLFDVPLQNLAKVAVDGQGGAWAATNKDVLRISASGEVLFSLAPLGSEGEVRELAADPADGSAWISGPSSVLHIDASGQLRHVLDIEPPVEIRDLAISSDTIPPELEILSPLAGSFLTTGTPPIEVAYGDGGAGVDAATLVFQLNGAPLATTCSFAAAGASCSPSTTLAEGTFTLAAGVRDFAGNASVLAQVIFTVGTPGGGDLPPDPATVAPPLDPTVAADFTAGVKFLYSGEDPIQTGVAPGTIEARRVAVLRGQVLSGEGGPLSGAVITVLGHPELGATLSRLDGMFDLAVNGGGPLTLEFRKPGYLTAQRTVDTPWRDYARVEDVVLLPLDTQATVISSGASALQVARGSAVTDEDGARRATVFFPEGTGAELVMPDGSRQPLAALTVRATEYTVGETGPAAMPAPLPPASGYTYAVELSVDEALAAGAVRVDFSQPVVFYLENFLDFPVGGIVPAGYYDRRKAAWLPSPNGRVVEVLSVTAGLADLDLDGSGAPADAAALTALGISESERRELALLYMPGQTLWRVPIPHFTPWDYNWPIGPPEDAEEPPAPGKDEDDEDDPCTQSGSIIECENQILGERVPVVGTPFSLNYRSDRVPGRRASRTIKVVLSRSQIPASLRRIELLIDVVGRRFQYSFAPGPNLTYTFSLDGKDAYGRPVQGEHPARISLGYVYGGVVYYTPAQLEASFASFSADVIVVRDRTRREYTLWRRQQRTLRAWDTPAAGLGGWDLDVHHGYDPVGRRLFLGDGSRRKGDDLNREMSRVTFNSDTQQTFDAEVGSDGSLYVIDRRVLNFSLPFMAISRRTPDGQFRSRIVGGESSDDVTGIGVAPDGSVYFGKCGGFPGSQVWRLAPDGNTDTLVLGPDRVGCPQDIAVERDGSLLIADAGLPRDTGLDKILRLRPDGSLTTVAGSSDPAAPDSGPALQVRLALNGRAHLALGPDGSIYFTEPQRTRIRRIGTDGQVATIAGTGTPGFTEDGLPALSAQLQALWGLTVTPDGGVLFAQPASERVRRITPSGFLVTEAGGGPSGSSTGGLESPSAPLLFPTGVALRQDGETYISGTRAYRVFASSPSFSHQDIVLASSGGLEVYVFDRQGRHLSTRHALTGATLLSFAYDSAGLLSAVADPFGNVTRVERDALGRPTAIVAPYGQRTELALDANGFLSSIKNPAAEESRFVYTSDGLLTEMTDPRGATARYSYSDLGYLQTAQDRAGGTKQLTRYSDANGWEVMIASPLGRETRYRREGLANGQRLRGTTSPAGLSTTSLRSTSGAVVTNPSGMVTTTVLGADPRFGMQAPFSKSLQVRTPSGLTLTTTSSRTTTLANASDPFSLTTLEETFTTNGRTERQVYNASQRKFTFTSAAGRTSVTTVDEFGRTVLVEAGGLAPVSFTYDTRGRLSSIVQGSGADQRVFTLAYGTDGWLSDVFGPLAYHLGFEYDAAGRLLRQRLPDGREIQFSYDANGNLTALTPPTRPSHTFGFTPIDLPAEYAAPALGEEPNRTAYTYNPDRQLTAISRPDGREIARSYGTDGRLLATSFSLGQLGFTYHPTTGTLSGVSAPQESLSYTHDGSLLTGTTWTGAVAGSVSSTYNTDFRLATSRVNGANAISFQYDPDGLITQAGALTLTYSPQHGLLSGTTLGQVTTSQSYNVFGELAGMTASFQGTPLYSTSYTRDQLGRILQKIETLGGITDTFDYTYDSAERLTDVQRGGAALSHYDYDGNSNRTAFTSSSGTVTATYDAQDRLLSYGDRTYSHSANGELTSKTQNGFTITYDYDELGNLRKVVFPEGTTIEYVIDGQNRRVGKKVNGTLSQGFLYGDQLQPIAELDGAGALVSRFIYGSGANVPDYMIKGGVTYRILSDHLGSPRLVVNAATGQVAQRIDFDEFGRVILDTNPGFQPFGFAGGLYDHQTDLVRLGARDYDPEVGRWTAKDPILFDGGSENLYSYSLNDPVNFTDTDGLRRTPATPPVVPQKTPVPSCPRPKPLAPGGSAPGIGSIIGSFIIGFFTPSAANAPTLDDVFGPCACSSENEDPRETRRICTKLYDQCYDNLGRHKLAPGWRCEDCMKRCIAQDGEWPYNECNLWYWPWPVK